MYTLILLWKMLSFFFAKREGKKEKRKKERNKWLIFCVFPMIQTIVHLWDRHACEVLHYTQRRWPVYDVVVETAKKREDASQVPVSSPI